jgi:hypothetical protein
MTQTAEPAAAGGGRRRRPVAPPQASPGEGAEPTVHTWPRGGIPAGQGYVELVSILDGAPVRIAVPEDAEGEAAALSEALNDPEIVAHVGSREALEAQGPPIPAEQLHAELGIEPAEKRYSGHLRLRLPKRLHGLLALQAQEEGVSLNTLMIAYLSERAALAEGPKRPEDATALAAALAASDQRAP